MLIYMNYRYQMECSNIDTPSKGVIDLDIILSSDLAFALTALVLILGAPVGDD